MKVKQFILGGIETNTYVVYDDDKCIVIDPPFDNFDTVERFVDQMNLQPVAVVLTHGHFDHCGGAQKLAGKYSVDIWAHPNDWQLAQSAEFNLWRMPCNNAYPTKQLTEDVTQIQGFDVQVLHTPGHTEGSVCLILGDVMFAGDTLFCRSVGRTDLADSDPQKMVQSLAKLKAIKQDYVVYSGHGVSTVLSDEQKNNPYLKLL